MKPWWWPYRYILEQLAYAVRLEGWFYRKTAAVVRRDLAAMPKAHDAYKAWCNQQVCVVCGAEYSKREKNLPIEKWWVTETQCSPCWVRFGPPGNRKPARPGHRFKMLSEASIGCPTPPYIRAKRRYFSNCPQASSCILLTPKISMFALYCRGSHWWEQICGLNAPHGSPKVKWMTLAQRISRSFNNDQRRHSD